MTERAERHWTIESAQGERCAVCGEQARHKVATAVDRMHDHGHEPTAYLCCACYPTLMGEVAGCILAPRPTIEQQCRELLEAALKAGLVGPSEDYADPDPMARSSGELGEMAAVLAGWSLREEVERRLHQELRA